MSDPIEAPESFVHKVEAGAAGIVETVGSALGSVLTSVGGFVHDLGVKLKPEEDALVSALETNVVAQAEAALPTIEAQAETLVKDAVSGDLPAPQAVVAVLEQVGEQVAIKAVEAAV